MLTLQLRFQVHNTDVFSLPTEMRILRAYRGEMKKNALIFEDGEKVHTSCALLIIEESIINVLKKIAPYLNRYKLSLS